MLPHFTLICGWPKVGTNAGEGWDRERERERERERKRGGGRAKRFRVFRIRANVGGTRLLTKSAPTGSIRQMETLHGPIPTWTRSPTHLRQPRPCRDHVSTSSRTIGWRRSRIRMARRWQFVHVAGWLSLYFITCGGVAAVMNQDAATNAGRAFKLKNLHYSPPNDI